MKLECRNGKRSLVGGAGGEQRDALLVLQHVILGSQRGVTRPGQTVRREPSTIRPDN